MPVRWQIFGCAAFCACGAAFGLITVLREMSYQLFPPARGPAYAGAALCAGIVLGLWMPRRIIRRRLERGWRGGGALPAEPDDSGGLKLEFAASLAGTLIVAFGLTWVALCLGAVFMEEYRALLARRFTHPVWLTSLLLSLPACAGLALAGAVGTTLLVALHGWHRLVTQPDTKVARLWASMLLGALAAGLLAQRIASPAILAWLAPLTVFVASVISVSRRLHAVGAATPQPGPRVLTRDELMSLLAAGLAAATVGTALLLTIPHDGPAAQELGLVIATLTGAACAGLVVTRALIRLRAGADWGPVALLLGAVALLAPYSRVLAAADSVALVRLAAVTGCAAVCVVLVGRRACQASRSVQHALSWVGRFTATGLGIALVFSPGCSGRWDLVALAMIVALVATAVAGLVLILDSRVKTGLRVGGLVFIGVWLCGVPAGTRGLTRALPAPEPVSQRPAAGPLVGTARRLVVADQFRTARLRPLPPSTCGSGTWQFDLAGPALDVVILEPLPGGDSSLVSDVEFGRRLLRRLTTRLTRGGRLVVELPTAPFVDAALGQFDPAAVDPAWEGFRLNVRDQADEYEAVVFGPDIRHLIRRHPLPAGWAVSLRPVRASSETPR